MAVVSLVFGIISIVGSFCTIYGEIIGGILGIVGIILGALGRKNPEKKGIATAGLICSIIGVVLCLALFIACVACAATVVAFNPSYFNS